jgi:anti-sigma factor (TIGR02949 family)
MQHEIECKAALALLEPYLDGELDRADARELEGHVDGCADCRAALSSLDRLRQALRDRELRHTAPPELRERLRSAQIELDADGASAPRSAPVTRRAQPAWLRMAAAWVIAFGAGGICVHMWNSEKSADSARSQIERDLFAAHWRALAATSPVDVISSDRHTVKPWFAGKLADAPVVQDFVDQGFALVGGRIDYIGSARVAALVYRHGQHLIDVFVLPPGDGGAGETATQLQGYTLSRISLGAQSAAIVSDMDPEEQAAFARLFTTPH